MTLHFYAGAVPAGRRVRAVCHCGFTTTPRVDLARARDALDTEHGRSDLVCGLCDRDRQEFAGHTGVDRALRFLRVVPIPHPLPGEASEFFACRDDLGECRRLAREIQRSLDEAALQSLERVRATL